MFLLQNKEMFYASIIIVVQKQLRISVYMLVMDITMDIYSIV